MLVTMAHALVNRQLTCIHSSSLESHSESHSSQLPTPTPQLAAARWRTSGEDVDGALRTCQSSVSLGSREKTVQNRFEEIQAQPPVHTAEWKNNLCCCKSSFGFFFFFFYSYNTTKSKMTVWQGGGGGYTVY